MTTAEAAALLGERGIVATAAQVKRWAAAGRFPGATKHANEWDIPAEALAAFAPPALGAPVGVWKWRKRRGENDVLSCE
jgi:hypothetical protein